MTASTTTTPEGLASLIRGACPAMACGSVPGTRAATPRHSAPVTVTARCVLLHRHHAHEQVAVRGVDRGARQRRRRRRRCDDGDLRVAQRHVVGRAAESHGDPAGPAHLVEQRHRGGVRVDGVRVLGRGEPDVRGEDDHDGVAGVDERGRDGPAVGQPQLVDRPAGREQGAGARAGGVEEVQAHRRAGAGDARDGERPGDGGAAVDARRSATRRPCRCWCCGCGPGSRRRRGVGTRPSSTANGPTAADRLPQLAP